LKGEQVSYGTNRDGTKTVMVVFGTRPEAIKLAPVIRELQRRRDEFRTVVCTTGQHREMLAQMLDVFGLQPDYDLGIMKPGQSLTEVTTAVMTGLDQLLGQVHVDMVLVQGDTTTAFAAALEAFYHRIPVGHVEAGLRTLDKYNPFPEEINRRLVSPVTDLHFAPTTVARDNLLAEGFSPGKVFVTGNTVIDALLYMRSQIEANPAMVPDLKLGDINRESMIVVTAHRRENFGGGLQQICEAIASLARSRRDVEIVYPVHLNPNVKGPVHQLLGGLPNVHLLPPLDYVSFVSLMGQAKILLTDSGGIQEEGPAVGKPVLVMREVSERPEAITAGSAWLVGTDSERIVRAVNTLLDDPATYATMVNRPNPFGDGTAAVQIVDCLERTLLEPMLAANRAR
jgi:UDP-N-acetylglucosamine 2-epimerase (non-hydrolysing)